MRARSGHSNMFLLFTFFTPYCAFGPYKEMVSIFLTTSWGNSLWVEVSKGHPRPLKMPFIGQDRGKRFDRRGWMDENSVLVGNSQINHTFNQKSKSEISLVAIPGMPVVCNNSSSCFVADCCFGRCQWLLGVFHFTLLKVFLQQWTARQESGNRR